MKELKGWSFKDSGKYYTEVVVRIPEKVRTTLDIQEYIYANYHDYGDMSLAFPMTEDWIEHPVPCIFPVDVRRQYSD